MTEFRQLHPEEAWELALMQLQFEVDDFWRASLLRNTQLTYEDGVLTAAVNNQSALHLLERIQHALERILPDCLDSFCEMVIELRPPAPNGHTKTLPMPPAETPTNAEALTSEAVQEAIQQDEDTTSSASACILDDNARLVFSPALAAQVGLNEAIVLQQVHYWLGKNMQAGREDHFKHERWWTYNTYEEWRANNFPFWSESTIKRVFTALEKRGLILSAHLARHPSDRCKWYSIDYEALARLQAEQTETIGSEWSDASGQNDPMDEVNLTRCKGSKWSDGTGQNDPMDEVNLTRCKGSKWSDGTGQNDPMIPETPENTPTEPSAEPSPDAKRKKTAAVFGSQQVREWLVEFGVGAPTLSTLLDLPPDHVLGWILEIARQRRAGEVAPAHAVGRLITQLRAKEMPPPPAMRQIARLAPDDWTALILCAEHIRGTQDWGVLERLPTRLASIWETWAGAHTEYGYTLELTLDGVPSALCAGAKTWLETHDIEAWPQTLAAQTGAALALAG